jgi:hypothetical protein
MLVSFFSCNACDRDCNGFVYHCDKCNFDLDVQCSLISDIFNHEGHEHRLILSSKSNSDKCSSCGSKGQMYSVVNLVMLVNLSWILSALHYRLP